MPARAPTHRVRHPNLGEAHIYIADSLLSKLASRNTDTRDGARSAVCIRFRKACRAKAGETWPYADPYPFIEWKDLAIERIEEPARPAATQVARKTTPTAPQRECCDDDNCVVCDQGNHGFCRKGCTLFD